MQEQLTAAEKEHASLQASLDQLEQAAIAAQHELEQAEARKLTAEQRKTQAEQDAREEAKMLKSLGPKVRKGEVSVGDALKDVNQVVRDLGGRDKVDKMLQQLEFGPLSEREWEAAQKDFERWSPQKGEEVLVRFGFDMCAACLSCNLCEHACKLALARISMQPHRCACPTRAGCCQAAIAALRARVLQPCLTDTLCLHVPRRTATQSSVVQLTSGVKVSVIDPPASTVPSAQVLVNLSGLPVTVKLHDLRHLGNDGEASTSGA